MATKKTPAAPKPEPETAGLRVKQFTAANVKRIEVVDIETDGKGGLVIIGGNNGAGKSSVLDGLLYALGGKAAVKKGTKVLREGETEGHVRADLGEVIINRRWTDLGTDQLTITTKDGHALKDTEAVLKSLVGDLWMDPLQFLGAKPADQRDTLMRVSEMDIDPAALQADYDKLFIERTDVNRQLKSAKAIVENAESEIGGVNMDGPSLEDAIAAKAGGEAWADTYQERTRARSDAARHRNDAQDAVQRLEDELAAMRVRVVRLGEQYEAADQALTACGEPPDWDAINGAIANARLRQQQSAAIAERDRMSEQANNLAEESKRMTTELEAILARKSAGLAAAKMPVPGLGFDSDGVTYNGLPFSQASGAEALRVSVAIAMAKNPGARIILSKDGSLLDKENLAVLGELCAQRGFQLWLERVGDGDDGAIVIEAGKVRA